MDKLYSLLPVLACPILMGTMMWFMMRGNNKVDQPQHDTAQEIAALRAEIAALRNDQHTTTGSTA